MLKIGLAVTGLALLLGAIPVKADSLVGLGPNTTQPISMTFNGPGNPIDVVLPSVLAGTGYEFDSTGGNTVFTPGATDLTPSAASTQTTALSLAGGPAALVTWKDIGGGGLPGIMLLQFTTSLQTVGTYDDLVLNIDSATEAFIPAVSVTPVSGGTTFSSPGAGINICGFVPCSFDSLMAGSGMQSTSSFLCGFLYFSVCTTDAPDPATAIASISSGEVYVAPAGTVSAPEPSSLSLAAIGLLSMFGLASLKRRAIFQS
jgi:hypothetical protein